MPNSAPLEVGIEPFPGYRLRQLLGKGGFAEVWEAQAQSGSAVALKFLRCTDSKSTPQELASLRAIQKIRHKNLIRMDNVFPYANYLVIVMELADGSLLDLSEAYHLEFGTPIVPEQVCLYMIQAAEAIDFLNTRQHVIGGKTVSIQHCDVKPGNFLLCGDVVKLADFGLAAVMTTSTAYYRKGGTPAYAAPEFHQNRLSDRSDQYSLAVTYCELRSGRLPFTRVPERFESSYVPQPPDLSILPEDERPIIARALSLEPSQRWPSSGDMVRELARVML